ncbi:MULTISPECIES: MarR family winged helix-turn-helix transcriptional regulator [unclassified Xanthobacter]|uniref:MarR family winged helix-turn-helix transcriptional regulator n=1 Tax=unclassified Xanthobacter TaxID=2623496 RepID=UPI001EDD9A8A|nr:MULTISPECIES: MarR family transcriptional regulator [unclassified Xanthobacter]
MAPRPDRLIFGQLVTRVARYWRRAIDQALAENGLSQATALPLLVLSRLGDDLRQGTIADELGLEGPSLVRIVEMLVAEGLVTRREDPTDRRAKLLRLTPQGRAQVERIEATIAALRTRLFSELTDAEVSATVQGLSKLERALSPERGT